MYVDSLTLLLILQSLIHTVSLTLCQDLSCMADMPLAQERGGV